MSLTHGSIALADDARVVVVAPDREIRVRLDGTAEPMGSGAFAAGLTVGANQQRAFVLPFGTARVLYVGLTTTTNVAVDVLP
jgi:hypothetical protein